MTPPEPSLVYNSATLSLMVLKSLRAERNMPQQYIAEHLNKTTSAWTKIENGQSPLTMDVFCLVCSLVQVHPSQVIYQSEHIATYLARAGFWPAEPGNKRDDLMPLVREFYHKSISTAMWNAAPCFLAHDSIMSNWPLTGTLPAVLLYCTDKSYRASVT